MCCEECGGNFNIERCTGCGYLVCDDCFYQYHQGGSCYDAEDERDN